ncbi:hypothetical protein [Yunchengibacter salinarum]|uniref:hypothetical protein n=1 Tax=Yunchengibacter salinarum TaxID=3133399 RepID=UPI0035B65096
MAGTVKTVTTSETPLDQVTANLFLKIAFIRILRREPKEDEINLFYGKLADGSLAPNELIKQLIKSDELLHKFCTLKPPLSQADALYAMLLARPVEDDKTRVSLAQQIVRHGWPDTAEKIINSYEFKAQVLPKIMQGIQSH